jgi:hypothetical protein
MGKSPKTGREVEPQRVHGPSKICTRIVRWVGRRYEN